MTMITMARRDSLNRLDVMGVLVRVQLIQILSMHRDRRARVMEKGYIRMAERDAPPNDNRNIYHFCHRAEDAAYWPTREIAEIECMDLNRGVTIPPGGTYLCTNFQVEEETADRFLIYGEAPFEILKNGLYLTQRMS